MRSACDACEIWYHGDCIGISQQDAKYIKHYYCDVSCQIRIAISYCLFSYLFTISIRIIIIIITIINVIILAYYYYTIFNILVHTSRYW